MYALIGDEIVVHARHVGEPDRRGTITGTRGPDGAPPFAVTWDDGKQVVFFPSADCTVIHGAAATEPHR